MRSGNKYKLHLGINAFWKFSSNLASLKDSSIFKLRLFFLSKTCLLLYNLRPFSIKFFKHNSFFIFSIWVFFFLKKKLKQLKRNKFNKKKINHFGLRKFNKKQNNRFNKRKFNKNSSFLNFEKHYKKYLSAPFAGNYSYFNYGLSKRWRRVKGLYKQKYSNTRLKFLVRSNNNKKKIYKNKKLKLISQRKKKNYLEIYNPWSTTFSHSFFTFWFLFKTKRTKKYKLKKFIKKFYTFRFWFRLWFTNFFRFIVKRSFNLSIKFSYINRRVVHKFSNNVFFKKKTLFNRKAVNQKKLCKVKSKKFLFPKQFKFFFFKHYTWSNLFCKINFFFSKKKKLIRFICERLWLKLIKKKLENIFYNLFSIQCFFNLKNIVYKNLQLSEITKLVFFKIPGYYKNFDNLLTIVRVLNYGTYFFNTDFLTSLIILEMRKVRFHRKFMYMLFALISLLQTYKNNNYIGVQLGLIGKLNGGRRKKNFYIYKGLGCFHNLSLRINFCQKHMFTKFGAFNFKAWIYYK